MSFGRSTNFALFTIITDLATPFCESYTLNGKLLYVFQNIGQSQSYPRDSRGELEVKATVTTKAVIRVLLKQKFSKFTAQNLLMP
jgi:hypothetical protein